jgi:hypothetical protein
MRKKPLLAIAVLTAALAGCTAVPQVPATDRHAPPSQNVALRTQGLLSASLGSSTVVFSQGYEITSQVLNEHLGHLVPLSTEPPADAVGITLVKHEAATAEHGERWIPVSSESEATDRFYRFANLREADYAELTFERLRTGSSATVVSPTRDASGLIRIPFPESADYAARLRTREEGTLRAFRPLSGEPAAYEIKADGYFIPWSAFRNARLATEVSLKDAKGDPLLGLKAENFLVGILLKDGEGEYAVAQNKRAIIVKELQAGKYQLDVTLLELYFTPSAYVLDLTIQNQPLIHDAQY